MHTRTINVKDKLRMASKAKKVIYAALVGNSLIAVAKFIGASITGSSAMVSEGIHSMVDTLNQGLLLYGIKRAKRPADDKHPFGYASEIYFWAFVVAVLIFAVGAAVSISHGIDKILEPHPIGNVSINYIILSLAIVFEAGAWWIAYREFKVAKGNKRFIQAIRESKDPTIFTVLFEDTAAIMGLVIAMGGIWLADIYNMPIFDAGASILIGVVLAITSVMLALETKGLLIGESATPEIVNAIYKIVRGNKNITTLNELRTLQRGPQDVLLAMSVEYRRDISIEELELTSSEIEKEVKDMFPSVKRIFVETQCASQHAINTRMLIKGKDD